MRRLVVGVVLALAVAGCGGDPKADPSPTPSPPSSSTTPAAPVMPEAAKANTKAGAVAFVRYYIELINHAQATGDIEALAAFESPGCASCRQVADFIKGIYAAGGSIQGGEWIVKAAKATPGDGPKAWVVDVYGDFQRSTIVPSASASPRSSKGGHAPSTFFVHRDLEWAVTKWTRGV